MFDSHQRDQFGLQDADNGAAVLMISESFEKLHHYICATYSSFNFELTPVTRNREEIGNQINNRANRCVYNRNDHTSASKSSCKKQAKRKRKQCNVENKCAFEISETDVNRTIGDTVYEIDMLDVSELYNLSTDNTFEYVDYLELPFHVHEYEETIRESLCKCCSCCFKILFKGQTFFIGRGQ